MPSRGGARGLLLQRVVRYHSSCRAYFFDVQSFSLSNELFWPHNDAMHISLIEVGRAVVVALDQIVHFMLADPTKGTMADDEAAEST